MMNNDDFKAKLEYLNQLKDEEKYEEVKAMTRKNQETTTTRETEQNHRKA